MAREEFIEDLKKLITKGSVFDNPGGGTSTIASIGEAALSYIRGRSRFYLPYTAIDGVLSSFSGETVTTSELKEQNPEIFDSNRGGHGCNCTVTFMILEKMGFTIGSIQGSGKRGHPFYITLKQR